jgi:hypothetical protein
VLRYGGQAHIEARRQLADRFVARRQPRQDRAPRRIREPAKDRIEARMVNHMV